MNVNALDFGATGDGVALCTKQIQTAIDVCYESGGGRVTVPSGRYLCGTLRLKSNVELHLELGAVIKASDDLDNYNKTEEYFQNCDCPPEKWCGAHLIICVEQENVAITGLGVIEGCADTVYGGELHRGHNFWWKRGYYEDSVKAELRPGQLVCFVECKNVTVCGVTMQMATCWTLFLHGCENVTVRGVRVFNDKRHANSDGIGIDTCASVTVSDCISLTGDDALTVRCNPQRLKRRKTCENVTVTNCVLSSSCCALRIGVGKGEIRGVTISNIAIKESSAAIDFIGAWRGHGGVEIRDVNITNVTASDTAYPLHIETFGTKIERINISNMTSDCKGYVLVDGAAGLISDFTVRDLTVVDAEPNITLPQLAERDRGDAIFKMSGVDRLALENVKLILRGSYYDERSKVAVLENCTLTCDRLYTVFDGKQKKTR